MGYVDNFKELKDKLYKLNLREKARADGKLNAFERMSRLFDDGEFVELDTFYKSVYGNINMSNEDELVGIGAGVITGYGKVDGRLVYAFSQSEFLNGAITTAHANKISRVIENAIKMGVPVVGFYNSIGAKVDEGIDVLKAYNKIIKSQARAKGLIPQISAICGACYGANSILAENSDFVLVEDIESEIFIANFNDYDLASHDKESSAKNGKEISSNHQHIDSDEKLIQDIKKLLSYLPNNCDELPISYRELDEIKINETLNLFAEKELVNDFYDIDVVINEISDYEYYELSKDFGNAISTGFIRLNGKSVGVVANRRNQNIKGSKLDIDAVKKAIKFIKTCDTYNIPILNIVDVEGLRIDNQNQEDELMRLVSELSIVNMNVDVPKISLIIGYAYGTAYIAMGVGKESSDLTLAWPGANVSSLKPSVAVGILESEKINSSENVKETREMLTKDYEKNFASPYNAAIKGVVDDIIEPKYTKYRLIEAFNMLETKSIMRIRNQNIEM